MKVNKPAQVKGHAKSQKWKDVRGKRCRPPISSSELNSSPVMARMIKEHQASVKKKPTVKRLKNKAKSVSDFKKNSSSGLKKSYSQANGSSAFTMDNESNDSQDWKEYSQSIQGNGV
ncbi:polynucleotide 5'-hydroxyl-kinase NOL9 [Lates japonicus]